MATHEVRTVTVVIEGGIIQEMDIPAGIRVVVREYDEFDHSLYEPGEIKRDFHGHEYIETVWESEG
jgi:hypothetical protein